jgi:hypothetical protein
MKRMWSGKSENAITSFATAEGRYMSKAIVLTLDRGSRQFVVESVAVTSPQSTAEGQEGAVDCNCEGETARYRGHLWTPGGGFVHWSSRAGRAVIITSQKPGICSEGTYMLCPRVRRAAHGCVRGSSRRADVRELPYASNHYLAEPLVDGTFCSRCTDT